MQDTKCSGKYHRFRFYKSPPTSWVALRPFREVTTSPTSKKSLQGDLTSFRKLGICEHFSRQKIRQNCGIPRNFHEFFVICEFGRFFILIQNFSEDPADMV